MNKDSFLRYIENDRDCEQDRLDMAVNRGLRRAKDNRFDTKKLFMLAAASVFTFAMCFTVNLMPSSTVVGYYQDRQKVMLGSPEALYGYIEDITVKLEKYLGGE